MPPFWLREVIQFQARNEPREIPSAADITKITSLNKIFTALDKSLPDTCKEYKFDQELTSHLQKSFSSYENIHFFQVIVDNANDECKHACFCCISLYIYVCIWCHLYIDNTWNWLDFIYLFDYVSYMQYAFYFISNFYYFFRNDEGKKYIHTNALSRRR